MPRTKKPTKSQKPAEQGSADDTKLAAKLEKISEMLEIARRVVEALETGEIVEKLADANLNIEDAMDAAHELIALGNKAAEEDEDES